MPLNFSPDRGCELDWTSVTISWLVPVGTHKKYPGPQERTPASYQTDCPCVVEGRRQRQFASTKDASSSLEPEELCIDRCPVDVLPSDVPCKALSLRAEQSGVHLRQHFKNCDCTQRPRRKLFQIRVFPNLHGKDLFAKANAQGPEQHGSGCTHVGSAGRSESRLRGAQDEEEEEAKGGDGDCRQSCGYKKDVDGL